MGNKSSSDEEIFTNYVKPVVGNGKQAQSPDLPPAPVQTKYVEEDARESQKSN
jgi:hypothetical protein